MRIAGVLIALIFISCKQVRPTSDARIEFTCSDKELEEGFRWAKTQAMKYVHRSDDPVGHWYEAALPNREAFCMRDVSHQLSGANLLGLADINKNLLTKFAGSISASRDWCGYWEINRYNLPAPVDYRSDSDFWYNLPANFDLLDACYRQFLWTGDSTYLKGVAFTAFYARTTDDYVKHWDANGDGVMEGTGSAKFPFRGIGSYNEGQNGVTGNDLIAAQFVGYQRFAEFLKWSGQDGTAYQARAKKLWDNFHLNWWDSTSQRYYQFLTRDGQWLINDPMQLFLLRWNFVPEDRARPILAGLLQQENDMNVEMRSYFARELFRYGHPAEAIEVLQRITDPSLPRREYPEVSFGTLEAFVEGLMGISVNMHEQTLTTLPSLQGLTYAALSHIPVGDGEVTVIHKPDKTTIVNGTSRPITWKSSFPALDGTILVNGMDIPVTQKRAGTLHVVEASTILLPGSTITAVFRSSTRNTSD